VFIQESHGPGLDACVAWLEAAQVSVTEASMVAVARAVGASPRATEYFKRGFPADGQPLTSEPRLPIEGEARMVTPVREALIHAAGTSDHTDGMLGPLLASLTHMVKVPVSDEVFSGVLRAPSDYRREIAQNVLKKSDIPKLNAYARIFERWAVDNGVLADVVDALGAGSDADAEILLDPLEDRTKEDIETDKELAAVDVAVRALVEMGPRGTRVAAKHVADPHPLVRRCVLEVLWRTDPTHFVQTVAASPQKLSAGDLSRAMTLANDDPNLIALKLLALAHPTLVEKVGPALALLPASKLVPALFALVAQRDSFSPHEVAVYRQLLDASTDSGPTTAQVLDQALTRAGKPEGVYWLAKLLALGHLAKTGGGPAKRAVVEKFVADTSSYEMVSITFEQNTGKEISRTPTKIYFAQLAKDALGKMK
jgi:hypothetical protein